MPLKWDTIELKSEQGAVNGIAPVIISASRATDIPAFYSDWFMHRLEAGYAKWINRFSGKPTYVSFEKTRVIVFWTKNPEPMFRFLPELDRRNLNYYFTFTLNDYEDEGLEPRLPSLNARIRIFQRLSDVIGREKVIWRFDPLILTNTITVGRLLEKISKVGDKLYRHTRKLVISFIDIARYRKVKHNLVRSGFTDCREFTVDDIRELAQGLQQMNSRWGFDICTCAEEIDLSHFGILPNKCIDDELMVKLFQKDRKLMNFLNPESDGTGIRQPELHSRKNDFKDRGQRKHCRCIQSKDIGQYNTCMHVCLYCYANSSKSVVEKNYAQYQAQDHYCESILC